MTVAEIFPLHDERGVKFSYCILQWGVKSLHFMMQRGVKSMIVAEINLPAV